MNKPLLPEMTCVPLPKFALDDWKTIRRLFEPLPAWKFRQGWLDTPTRDLLSGSFKAATWSDAVVVYAELQDRDIFNPVMEFNEVAFTHGDAFEMFLRPEGQSAYYEFHVTPHNQKLQLRIPSAEWFAGPRKMTPEEFYQFSRVHKSIFDSRTLVCAEEHKWYVVTAIPFASVVENEDAARARRWRFSASRYDYTRGLKKPVLSSTSPHTACNFHRQQEWGTLHLVPLSGGVEHKLPDVARASI